MLEPSRARGLRKPQFSTPSGLPLSDLYDASDLEARGFEPDRDLGLPGEYPFTRGVQATQYRGRLWTMRQYAGFGTAQESNQRYKFLLAAGQTGLSVAFDLPTQMGRDPDHALSQGEVGRTGVSIATLDDMRTLLDGIPLDQVSTSMTINATAAILLALYVAVADERGTPRKLLAGTIQNDILKEYIARGTYVYPPGPSLRLIADTFAFCQAELPRWNSISVSGYHIREAGSDAVQELAFTLANGITYVETALAAGLGIDDFAPRVSFFFNAHANLLEEVAKFRAARRMWARLMTHRWNAQDPRSWALRFHAQTAGSTLVAREPLNNVVRTTIEALAAVLGGAQSLHTNGYDEALSLPTETSARLALRTQQILAHESGVGDVVDPLGGAYAVEALTHDLETQALALIERIEAMGGMRAAIETGFPQREIENRAFQHQRGLEDGSILVVAQNAFCDAPADAQAPGNLHKGNPEAERAQVSRLLTYRQQRGGAHQPALQNLSRGAAGSENLVTLILTAVKAGSTLGEVADVLRAVFGEHRQTVQTV